MRKRFQIMILTGVRLIQIVRIRIRDAWYRFLWYWVVLPLYNWLQPKIEGRVILAEDDSIWINRERD